MPLGIIAEALLRVEHKIDLVLRHLNAKTAPMHFIGAPCPVCFQTIDYALDLQKNVAVRKCGCKSGKQPSVIPLMQLSQENVNGRPPQNPPEAGDVGSEDGPRGKAR